MKSHSFGHAIIVCLSRYKKFKYVHVDLDHHSPSRSGPVLAIVITMIIMVPSLLICLSHTLADLRLGVDVAKWRSANRVHQLADRAVLCQDSKVENIFHGSVPTRGPVVDRNSAGNLEGVPKVQSLPQPVHAVDHRMVKEERRVNG